MYGVPVPPLRGNEKVLLNGGGRSDATTQEIANLGAGNVTAAQILALDFSAIPTSDPGGGKLWLNGNVVSVGTITP